MVIFARVDANHGIIQEQKISRLRKGNSATRYGLRLLVPISDHRISNANINEKHTKGTGIITPAMIDSEQVDPYPDAEVRDRFESTALGKPCMIKAYNHLPGSRTLKTREKVRESFLYAYRSLGLTRTRFMTWKAIIMTSTACSDENRSLYCSWREADQKLRYGREQYETRGEMN